MADIFVYFVREDGEPGSAMAEAFEVLFLYICICKNDFNSV